MLKHALVPDDIKFVHFDFLLEDKTFCRTWRLDNIPLLDGPYVACKYIAPHNLYWLDVEEKVVSGNRGVATRIKKGTFKKSLPSIENSYVNLSLDWEGSKSDLLIDEKGCRILSRRH